MALPATKLCSNESARAHFLVGLLLLLSASCLANGEPGNSKLNSKDSAVGHGDFDSFQSLAAHEEFSHSRRGLLMSEDEDSPSSRKALRQQTSTGALEAGTGDAQSQAIAGQGSPGAAAEGSGVKGTLELLRKKKKGMLDAFISSLSMILVTEIGDETFIIAALMAMRHSRTIVLAGALAALAIMTVLSTCLGMIVPNLISRKATNQAAAGLYTFFGLRLLYIAWKADPKDTPQKEMEEVEEKLEVDENGKGNFRVIRKFLGSFCTPVFLEAFILTFLAEWGDRSQIATITLAAHKDAIGVTVGAILGHVLCTSLAVVGGRLLALKISQRTVALVGGLLFLVFAVHSFFAPIIDD